MKREEHNTKKRGRKPLTRLEDIPDADTDMIKNVVEEQRVVDGLLSDN